MHATTAATRPAPGFTLLEVLVVVVILAVLASLVAVRVAPDRRQSLREEATRLAAVLGHAHDEAIVTGAAIAWQPDANGYRFVRRDPDRVWRAVDSDAALRARAFAAGVELAAVETPERTTNAAPAIVLQPTGASAPFRITLALADHRVRVSSDGRGRPVVEDDR
ncbi:MAG: type II secretion system minor pseudopilin GspH [Burkholderiales bacterium]